jgi:Cu-Zn family superoxide dismutase
MFSVTESDVRRRVAPLVAVLLAAVLLAAVLATVPTASDAQEGAERAVAALVDDGGEDAGEVGFADVGDGRTFVYAELDLERVSDGGFHGFHVHENASCEDGFAAAGGHYDLGGADHGAHAGDMPVLLADGETGDAVAGFVIERFTVDELLDEGTAVIVHERADNYANVPDRYESDGETGPDGDTLATGDAGARVACGVVEEGEGPSPDAQRTGRIAQAEVAGPDGEVSGTATFGELDDGRVLVSADVEGLPGGGVHGFHVHGTGSCEDGFAAAGGHFNTGGADHGAHAGDMPVLLADEDGTAEAQFVTDRVTVDDLLESDDGTAVIVHAARTTTPTSPTATRRTARPVPTRTRWPPATPAGGSPAGGPSPSWTCSGSAAPTGSRPPSRSPRACTRCRTLPARWCSRAPATSPTRWPGPRSPTPGTRPRC